MTTWATSKYVTDIDAAIVSIKAIETGLEAFSTRLSTFYLDSLKSTQEFGAIIVCGIIAGVILIFSATSIITDLMYKAKRSNSALKKFTVASWCSCCAATLGFSMYLNFIVPIIGSTEELAKIIEPASLNPTFYGKLEYPEAKLRADFYPCFFGGRRLLIR